MSGIKAPPLLSGRKSAPQIKLLHLEDIFSMLLSLIILVIMPKLANLEEVNKEMDSYPALLLSDESSLHDGAAWRKSYSLPG